MTTNIISKTPAALKNEWRTPLPVFEWARSLLGGIDFDTACTKENALAMPIYVGVDPDALAVEWHGRCWCNPPYDFIEPWVTEAIGSSAITAMLIPTPNGEDRYGALFEHSHEISIVGRLAFIGADGKPVSGNTRGSSLFIINGYGQGSRSFITREEIFKRFGGVKTK